MSMAVKALPTNAGTVQIVENGETTGWPLDAGESIAFDLNHHQSPPEFRSSSAGDKVAYMLLFEDTDA